MSKLDYKKFSRGDTCTEEGCKAKKWYLEDGKRYCDKGHEQVVRIMSFLESLGHDGGYCDESRDDGE